MLRTYFIQRRRCPLRRIVFLDHARPYPSSTSVPSNERRIMARSMRRHSATVIAAPRRSCSSVTHSSKGEPRRSASSDLSAKFTAIAFRRSDNGRDPVMRKWRSILPALLGQHAVLEEGASARYGAASGVDFFHRSAGRSSSALSQAWPAVPARRRRGQSEIGQSGVLGIGGGDGLSRSLPAIAQSPGSGKGNSRRLRPGKGRYALPASPSRSCRSRCASWLCAPPCEIPMPPPMTMPSISAIYGLL